VITLFAAKQTITKSTTNQMRKSSFKMPLPPLIGLLFMAVLHPRKPR
jgi:hypothetical protein